MHTPANNSPFGAGGRPEEPMRHAQTSRPLPPCAFGFARHSGSASPGQFRQDAVSSPECHYLVTKQRKEDTQHISSPVSCSSFQYPCTPFVPPRLSPCPAAVFRSMNPWKKSWMKSKQQAANQQPRRESARASIGILSTMSRFMAGLFFREWTPTVLVTIQAS